VWNLAAPGAQPHSLHLDATSYPRTYRMRRGWRAFLVALGLVVASGGIAAVVYFAAGHEVHGPADQAVMVAIGVLFAALGLYLVVDALVSRVTLTLDEITVHDLMPTRRLRRDEIAGRRLLRAQSMNILVLEPRRPGTRRLKLPFIVEIDQVLAAWLDALPDLDARDQARSEAEVLALRAPGRTEEQQREWLERARRTARWGNLTAVAAALWGFFFPRPYAAAMLVLAVLPWAAVLAVARSRGLLAVDERRNEARPNVAAPMLLPGFVLMLRAVMDLQLVSGRGAVAPAVLGAAALTTAALASDAALRKRAWIALVFLLLFAAWGYGASVEANALLDRGPAQLFETRVLGKTVSRGKTTTYALRLAPWGPRTEADDAEVPRIVFENVREGDAVVVRMKPGALGLPWFRVVLRR